MPNPDAHPLPDVQRIQWPSPSKPHGGSRGGRSEGNTDRRGEGREKAPYGKGEEHADSRQARRSGVCGTGCSLLLSIFVEECNKIICTKRVVDLSS